MPARSTKFQRLVFQIQKQMAPLKATVTQSELLIDPVTKRKREADIFVQLPTGISTSDIVIEVREFKRKQDITWLDQASAKWKNFGFNVFLVSKSGFTKTATKDAGTYGVRILNWDEAVEADWSRFALANSELPIAVRYPKLNQILIDTDPKVPSTYRQELENLNVVVHTIGDTKRESLTDFSIQQLDSVQARSAIQSQLVDGGNDFAYVSFYDPSEKFLEFNNGQKFGLKTLVLKGYVDIVEQLMTFKSFKLGDAEGAWGEVSLDDDSSITATVSSDEDGTRRIGFSTKGIHRLTGVTISTKKETLYQWKAR